MEPRLLAVTARELRERRERLLSEVGMSAEALRRVARKRELSAEQWQALEQLDEIDFLLGDAAAKHGKFRTR